jgi:uncharacterized protein YqeY
MPLKTQIDEAIKTAMRAKEADALRALRAIKSAILLAETAEGRPNGELSETEEMQLLTKQAKQRRDSIAQFDANGREDLAAIERAELAVIEGFLPKALSPNELETELRAIIAELGVSGPAALGQVMKTASGRLAGRADGKAISEMVRKLLA